MINILGIEIDETKIEKNWENALILAIVKRMKHGHIQRGDRVIIDIGEMSNEKRIQIEVLKGGSKLRRKNKEVKEFATDKFYRVLKEYKEAIKSREDIVSKSLAVHAALNDVAYHCGPIAYKRCKTMMNKAFRGE